VSALAVGGGNLVWATADHALFTRPLDDTNAAPVRLSGPLASDTPLVVSANGYLAWVDRAARTASEGTARHAGKEEAVPPGSLRRIFSAPLDALLDKSKTTMAECPTWPLAFAADASGAYCCDAAKPIARASCNHGRCTSEPYDALCPGEIAMDADRLYFAQDVRLLALDRRSGKLKAVSKRKRRPRNVTLGDGFLYWLEGDRSAEVWRIALNPSDGSAPEILARPQSGAALAVDEAALYFVADAPQGGGNAIYRLPLPSR
jgi:hypothetical protein